MTQDMNSKMIIEHNIFPHWGKNIPTLGKKYSHAGEKTGLRLAPDDITSRRLRDYVSSPTRLRLVVSMLLMLCLGVSEAWGQQMTDFEGAWYIACNGDAYQAGTNTNLPYTYNPATHTTNFYLRPADDPQTGDETDAFFDGTGRTQPFLTSNYTGHAGIALWILKKTDNSYTTSSGSDYYYTIQHAETEKYLVCDPFFSGTLGDKNNSRRKTMHLETKSWNATIPDKALFKIRYTLDENTGTGDTSDSYCFIPKRVETKSYKYLNLADRNQPVNYGTNRSNTSDYYGGLAGLYTFGTNPANTVDPNSRFKFEPYVMAQPTITFNNATNEVTITSSVSGAMIYYTTNGDTPTSELTFHTAPVTFIQTTPCTIRAIAVKSWSSGVEVSSEEATPYVLQKVATPTFSFNNSTNVLTITSSTTESSIYYSIGEGSTPETAYSSPLEIPYVQSNQLYRAIAVKDGMINSEVATKTIVMNPTITLTIPEGGYTYDGNAKTPSISSVMVGETPISSDDYDVSYENNTNAGTTATVIIREKTGNETIIYGTTTFTINGAPLTVTANDNTITYGDAPAANGVSYTGFVNDENESVISGTLGYSSTYTQYDDIGTYTITPGGLTSDNYEITFAPGTLTVTQKEVGLEWGNTTLNYTGGVQAPTATATGTVNGDVIGVTVEGGQTDIGTGYTATATALTGEKAGNYKLPAENTIEFSIQTSTLTITANSYTIHYGDPRPNYAVTYEGFVNGDNASTLSGKLTYTCDYARGEDVGTYTITPKGLRSDKYEITFVAGTLTVNPKEVGLSWETTELTYTGTAQVPTATATGLVNDDEIDVTVEVTGDHTNVDDYTAAATGLTGTKVSNYTLPTANTTSFSIVKAPLTVTANNHTITYGDAPAANGVSYTGFVNNETSSVLGGDLSYAYDYNQYDNVVRYNGNDEVVPYAIIPSGLTATNYAIAFEAGTLTVNPKEVRLTWTGTSFPYDGEAHAPTVTMTDSETDLVHGDVITVDTPTLSANTGSSLEENGTAVQVGYYRATTSLTGTKAGNYKPVPAIQPFTISSLSIGDGNDPAEDIEIATTDGSSVTVTDGETILVPNTHYTVEIETQGVDHYITVTGKGNYSGSARILYVTPDFNRPTDDNTDYAAVYQASSDLAQPDGITPCIIKSVNPSARTLTATPVGYLPKDVPVVLVAASDISGFQASAKPDNVTAITDQTKNSNLLKVSPTGGVTVAATQIYLFNAGEFVLTMPGTLPAGYFYLDNPNYHATGTTSGARYRLQMVIAPPTDINDGEWKMDEVGDDAWYTLDGRRLNGKPTRKGMYIANGKKIIIR